MIASKTHVVKVGNLFVGGGNPIVVQSMTDTDTSDIIKTVSQIQDLVRAGSEVVRVTVNDEAAAQAIPKICEQLKLFGCDVPIVGDFHYNGHRLLRDHPECAKALAKYRINPGNVGFGDKKDTQFAEIIKIAIKYNKPVRIGVNWGSLDKALSAKLMDENANLENPKTPESVTEKALVMSALQSAQYAERLGLAPNKILISCKVSEVSALVRVYEDLASKCNYALHLGLTEAGMGLKGIVSSSMALGILLKRGIGDTIRVSITPEPGQARTKEVEVCQNILQELGLRNFKPSVTSCPGCGRTTSTFFRELASEVQSQIQEKMPEWKARYPGVENLKLAVMGCVVNGPGESKHADIGISLPGKGEAPSAPVFIDGKKITTLRGENIASEFKGIVENYIDNRFG